MPTFAALRFYGSWLAQVAVDVARTRPDIVYVMQFSQGIRPLRTASPRSYLALHVANDWLSQLQPQLVEPRLRKLDMIVCCSDYLARRIQDRYGASPVIAPNGVDTNRFSPSSENKDVSERIVYVGRLAPDKGIHVLLDAFARVAVQRPNAELVLVGRHGEVPPEFRALLKIDPELAALAPLYSGDLTENLLERMPPAIRARVKVIPHVPYDHVHEMYQGATVFAFPSVWSEPFGMPSVEAMACGVPVVASRAGALPEIVADGENGILVAPGDAGELAAAIDRLLADPSTRHAMGARGRATALSTYDWDRIANDIWTNIARSSRTWA